MRHTTCSLTAAAFVVGAVSGWILHANGVAAQAPPPPFTMQRIYTGADGLSHVERIPIDASTVLEAVTKVAVSVSKPGSFSDYHVAPERRYIVNLTGGGQLRLADGVVDLPPGSIEYIDDLTGKGHTTANVGTEPRVSLILPLASQRQTIGPIGPRR